MLNAYERGLILSYLVRLFRYVRGKGCRREEIGEWLEERAHVLAIDELTSRVQATAWDDERSRRDWIAVQNLIERAHRAAQRSPPDRLGRRLKGLGETVGLSSLDVVLLDAALRYETQPVVEELLCAFGTAIRESRRVHQWSLNSRSFALAHLLGITTRQLEERLLIGAPLVRSGLISVDGDGDFRPLRRLRRMALAVSEEREQADVRRLLLGASATTDLDWSDFDHLGQAREDVARLVGGALDRGSRGVNILLYGPSGTGKTEFCRTLAKHSGADLFSVAETDDDGGEPSRQERLAELRLAQCLLAGSSTSVLLVDEMEDLLWGMNRSWLMRPGRAREEEWYGYSKVFMHRLLEETPVPTLWTTNRAGSMDAALLRRMTFAVEVRQPPPRVRARIWSRQLDRRGVEATTAQALALAREFDASPGVAAGAVSAAAVSEGGIDLVCRGVRSLSRLLGRERPTPRASLFDPRFLDADMDLADLAGRLADRGERRFSMCLQGAPGTGKSAYARHLADCLGLEVVQKRASDLLGMFVGETEDNIARTFADARDDEAFLIFDEVDSLLADRRGAHRNWEITQVNEMLTWMEDHPLPFACTTNYGEKLDVAVLRRFTFKVTLGYLGTEAARGLFHRYFGVEAPPELDRLAVLAPGDFPVVRRKAEVLGSLEDRDALVVMLRAECAAKPDHPAPIGFARP